MRVILLTHGGADLVIDRLARLEGVEVAGVFIEKRVAPERGPIEKLKRSIKYDGVLATLAKVGQFRNGSAAAADQAADPTREAAERLGIPVFDLDDYHAPESIETIRSSNADLGVIFGTNIIKESMFSIPKLGSINLHQGMAPYYRGGPPVFWELYNGEKEIGLTVHFVAAKVDTGDIIMQKAIPLEYDPGFGLDFESFIFDFRAKLRGESASLISEAVSSIAAGVHIRNPQDISLGKRYRLPTKKEKNELRRRLKERLAKGAL
ncbi:MAG: formyltransferase family protein [Pyrinomonadaceae bacterium]